MSAEEMLRRLEILEDIEAIKRLKRSYCYYADDGISGNSARWEDFITHWVNDCWADFGPFGVHHGKQEVAQFYKKTVPSILSYSAHMVTNPIIDVSNDTASGKWYVFVPCTTQSSNEAAWLLAKYDEEYVKDKGEWKWKSITARFDFISPFSEGWVKTPMVGS